MYKLISIDRMSKRILESRFSGKHRWSNETLARLKQVSRCFRRVLFISLKCHTSLYPSLPPPPPYPYGFDIPVNDSWEFLVVVCRPVLKILTLLQTNLVIILLCCYQDGYLSGAMSFDAGELESAISSVIFEIIEREKSVSSAASEVNSD